MIIFRIFVSLARVTAMSRPESFCWPPRTMPAPRIAWSRCPPRSIRTNCRSFAWCRRRACKSIPAPATRRARPADPQRTGRAAVRSAQVRRQALCRTDLGTSRPRAIWSSSKRRACRRLSTRPLPWLLLDAKSRRGIGQVSPRLAGDRPLGNDRRQCAQGRPRQGPPSQEVRVPYVGLILRIPE